MLRKLRNRIKGQSTAEYAILIALVVAAVIAMQTYAKRALQAKVRDAALYMTDQTSNLGNSIQYEPYYLTTNFEVTREQRTNMILTNEVTAGIRQNSTANVAREGGGFQEFNYSNASINLKQ